MLTNQTLKKSLSATALLCSAVFMSQVASAREYPVGGPIYKDGMEIASSYLVDIETNPSPQSMIMGKDVVHLESDVHATQDNKWGFPNGAWIPYMSIDYVVTKVGDPSFMEYGQMLPMTAGDGPHYAHSVQLKGKGTYVAHLQYTAPDEKGFLHHVDKATGVPTWFKPFKVDFKFKYPQS